ARAMRGWWFSAISGSIPELEACTDSKVAIYGYGANCATARPGKGVEARTEQGDGGEGEHGTFGVGGGAFVDACEAHRPTAHDAEAVARELKADRVVLGFRFGLVVRGDDDGYALHHVFAACPLHHQFVGSGLRGLYNLATCRLQAGVDRGSGSLHPYDLGGGV